MMVCGGRGTISLSGKKQRNKDAGEFARLADQAPRGVLSEVFGLLAHNKKWWLLPIVLLLLLSGAIVLLGGTAAAPFIYTLF